MQKRIDEFLFLFMMFLFATGWATGWSVWHVIVLSLCVIYVLIRSFWPRIQKMLGKEVPEEEKSDKAE